MQTIGITEDLAQAINLMEELLNTNDGDSIIEALKEYKKDKKANPAKLKSLEL